MYHCLKARVERDEEWWPGGQRQNALLDHRALDVIVLDDHVLLQDLHRIDLIGAFPLR